MPCQSEKQLLIQKISSPISYDDLSATVFLGELAAIRQNQSAQQLRDYIATQISSTLDDSDPTTIHHRQAESVYRPKLEHLQKTLPNDPTIKSLWQGFFSELGWETGEFAWDFMPLRIVPPQRVSPTWERHTVAPHRDTWGSNLPNQLNWWTSIFPLSADNTLGFWTDYFDKPIKNDTATWSYKNYISARKRGDKSIAVAPKPLENLDYSALQPLLPNVGEMACFSSQHLHASIPNSTDRFRFSIELRTIHLNEAKHGKRGAKNVDNAQTKPQLNWFKPIKNSTVM